MAPREGPSRDGPDIPEVTTNFDNRTHPTLKKNRNYPRRPQIHPLAPIVGLGQMRSADSLPGQFSDLLCSNVGSFRPLEWDERFATNQIGNYMPGRTIAIGDIHGCGDALAALIDAIVPTPDDTIIALGDYIDRGPDSEGVVAQFISLGQTCRLIPLMGNHEEVFLDALNDITKLRKWLESGGAETLRSYGWTPGTGRRLLADWIPEAHRDFIAGCLPYYETSTHIFVHAGYVPDLPMSAQPALALRWRVTDPYTTIPHCSGKTAVVGHTVQHTGEILDLAFLVCIDTNCVRSGWLTALDVHVGHFWQADRAGKLRPPSDVGP
jgi:serine/threonine protein phosphatase 1